MQLPKQPQLPFFAYGAFRPGELAFHRLKPFVAETKREIVAGQLRLRDGLPIFVPGGSGKVSGVLLLFREGAATQAYQAIAELEPAKQYRWGEAIIGPVTANVLWGRFPNRGSIELEEPWDGRKDPLFTSALDVVQETLAQNRRFEWNLQPLFRLQMAYLLLWSAIERYLSFRYHLGDAVWQKVQHLAEEPAFAEVLGKEVHDSRALFRADDPRQRVLLDPGNPAQSLEYYYQIRSNITHRGKAVVRDHDRLHDSLKELLAIFRHVLDRAFEEASLDKKL